MMNQEQDLMRQIYEDYDAHNIARYAPMDESMLDDPRLVQIHRLVGTGKRVLDVGCSLGELAVYLSRRVFRL